MQSTNSRRTRLFMAKDGRCQATHYWLRPSILPALFAVVPSARSRRSIQIVIQTVRFCATSTAFLISVGCLRGSPKKRVRLCSDRVAVPRRNQAKLRLKVCADENKRRPVKWGPVARVVSKGKTGVAECLGAVEAVVQLPVQLDH